MKRKVLVVDDDEDVRVLVSTLLEAEGYEVLLAQDGASAMVIARHNDPDAILLDIGLPAGDGFTVLRRMRQAGATTPIVVLTGRTDDASREQAEEAGASAYLTKPVDRDRLLSAIEREIRAHTPKGSAVHCPQCGWSIPLATLDNEALEAAVRELRSRKGSGASSRS